MPRPYPDRLWETAGRPDWVNKKNPRRMSCGGFQLWGAANP